MRVVLVVVLMLGGCRCKDKPVEVPAVPRVTTTWAPHEVAAVPDDVYGVPAWSKVFALAFERKISIGVPSCHLDGGCLGVDPLTMRGEPMVSKEMILGRDEPLAFIGEQVTFLEAPDTGKALESASLVQLARAMTSILQTFSFSEAQKLKEDPSSEVAQSLFEAKEAIGDLISFIEST